MSVVSDREIILRKIYRAVDSLGRLDHQRLQQWTRILEKSAPEEIFYALYSVLTSDSRQERKYLDQEYAGNLLLALHPPCFIEPQQAVRGVLRNYDFSIEQLPLYFERVLGRGSLIQILEDLRNQPLTQREQRSLETFIFWLKETGHVTKPIPSPG